MVIVTVALGLAAAMSAALLSTSVTRSRIAANAYEAAVAHALAESGANVAMYYLLYPDRYAGPKPDGYYPGETSIFLGNNAPGTVRTAVTFDGASNAYAISATAAVARSGGEYTRTLGARVQVLQSTTTQIDPAVDALVTNAPTTLNSRVSVTGSVKTFGDLDLVGGKVTGSVGADTVRISAAGTISETTRTLGAALIAADATATSTGGLVDPATVRDGLAALVPAVQHLPDLRTYDVFDALGLKVTYAASPLASDTYDGVTLNPNVLTNPRGVFVASGSADDIADDADADDRVITIQGTVTVNGTLVLRGARLRLAPNAVLQLRPQAGFPALITDGAIAVNDGSVFAADGLVYAHRIVGETPAPNASFAISGALLLRAATNPLPEDIAAPMMVVYDQARAQVSGFGTVRPPAFSRGVRVLAWNE